MKLWDSLTTCLILLSAVRASVSPGRSAKRGGSEPEDPLELPQAQMRLARSGLGHDWGEKLPGREKGTGSPRDTILVKNKKNRNNDRDYSQKLKYLYIFHALWVISGSFNLY
ncbi:unnamed protein product [Tetraodon nigroviridis]|uniref:(spotted green pufferfish) hypothetical protein n=1 Tax=Tetraodon nigroviridis TaxID=99883 RepID=Q4RT72_TETNG|nr:unnamed protein product [Tetraodon nigroviridis]